MYMLSPITRALSEVSYGDVLCLACDTVTPYPDCYHVLGVWRSFLFAC